jgi:hypothetical protein
MAFVYADRYVYAKTSELEVADFTAWRRSGKQGRLFRPFLHLKSQDFVIVIDGYHKMWQFLEVLLGKVPRTMLNHCMKGNIEGVMFEDELRHILDAKDGSYTHDIMLCFDTKYEQFAVPNSDKTLDAYCSDSVRNAETGLPDYPTYTPAFSGRTIGIVWVPTRIHDADPQYVFERRDGFLCAFVSVPDGPNYRYINAAHFDDLTALAEASQHIAYHVQEHEYVVNTSGLKMHSASMYDLERDRLESELFSRLKHNSKENKRGTAL